MQEKVKDQSKVTITRIGIPILMKSTGDILPDSNVLTVDLF
jgi:hypothetical protein